MIFHQFSFLVHYNLLLLLCQVVRKLRDSNVTMFQLQVQIDFHEKFAKWPKSHTSAVPWFILIVWCHSLIFPSDIW